MVTLVNGKSAAQMEQDVLDFSRKYAATIADIEKPYGWMEMKEVETALLRAAATYGRYA